MRAHTHLYIYKRRCSSALAHNWELCTFWIGVRTKWKQIGVFESEWASECVATSVYAVSILFHTLCNIKQTNRRKKINNHNNNNDDGKSKQQKKLMHCVCNNNNIKRSVYSTEIEVKRYPILHRSNRQFFFVFFVVVAARSRRIYMHTQRNVVYIIILITIIICDRFVCELFHISLIF